MGGRQTRVGDRARIQAALLLALHMSGCGFTDDALPPIVWEGEHFFYATNIERPLCASTLEKQDELTALLQGILGAPEMGRKYVYYEMTEEEFATGPCPEAGGCYNPSRGIFSPAIFNIHEIVHAVNDLSKGLSHSFFSEGVAEVFRDRYGGVREIQHSVSEGLAASSKDFPYDMYGRAGHFAAYLFDTFGEDTVVELLAHTRRDQSADELHRALETATGLPYAQLLADYAEYPECDNLSYRWPVLECASPPSPWTGCAWETTVTVGCESDGVIGPRSGEIWTSRTVEVPNHGVYYVTVLGDPDASAFVEFARCDVGCSSSGYFRFEPGDVMKEVVLDSGLFHVTLVRGEDAPGELGFRIARGVHCGETPP